MKKILLSIIVIAGFGFYVLYANQKTDPVVSVADTTTSVPEVVPVKTPVQDTPVPPVTIPKTTPPPPKKTATGLVDGSYVGPSVDVYYGNVSVKAVIKGGKITDIQFLDYPKDRSTSLYKSMNAMPILKQEAIAAQSYKVDTVSGATETSMGFRKSLADALSQAQV